MNKHTPGPWTATKTKGGKGKVVNHNGFSVATMMAGTYKQQEHDAALTAAAPDLLKLAEALVQSWEACADGAQAVRHNDGTIINVRALIARATGES